MSNNNIYFFDYSRLFLQDYLPKCGRSINTISSYKDTLTIFKDWLEGTGRDFVTFAFQNVTADLVHEFLDWLRTEKGNSELTCNHRLMGLKVYVEYCVSKDIAIASVGTILSRIKPYRIPVKIKETLTPEQVKALIDTCPNTPKGARNKMIILLVYESAVRVSELSSLKRGNVYLDPDGASFLLLMGKGKKERTIPLVGKTPHLLEQYINEYVNPVGSEYIFYTFHGGCPAQMSIRRIQEIIDKCADKAREIDPTIPESVHPHMFRRSKATTLYRNGMQLEQVSSILGHSNVETTRIYATASIEQIRNTMEKVTPRKDIDDAPLWEGKTKDLAKTYGLR